MPASPRIRATTRLALFTVIGACSAAEPGAVVLREASIDAPASPRAPLRQRGTLLGGEKVARVLAWPAEDSLVALARDRYDANVREAIARSPVPVLAPGDPFGPFERATMTVGAHWYALAVHGDGWTIHVDGSGQARNYPHIKAVERTHPMRSGDGFFTRNEGVWSATWIEHGAAYSFEVQCEGDKQAWCEDEAAVLAKLETLVYVGGKRVRS
jgi:hypothetical protein